MHFYLSVPPVVDREKLTSMNYAKNMVYYMVEKSTITYTE